MLVSMSEGFIEIKGARVHNLKNIDVRIPRGKLVVVTGLSGSGKSSLAFDTLYAEGYRKYMESLSVGARSLLEQMARPEVDYIEGLTPVIAIEQHEAGFNNPRTTVASVTEILDYARLLWPVAGVPHCPECGGEIRHRTLDEAVDELMGLKAGTKLILVAPIAEGKSAVVREELARLEQKGFSRVRVNGEIRELVEPDLFSPRAKSVKLEVVVDRIVLAPDQRSRIADSLEIAFKEGHDAALAVELTDNGEVEHPLRQSFACVKCGKLYPALTPKHFSYNHPEGACPVCGGLGKELKFAPQLVVPDPTKSVHKGAIKAWRVGPKRIIIRQSSILKQLAEQLPFDANCPWEKLPEEVRHFLLWGDPERVFKLRSWSKKHPIEERPFEGVMAALDSAFRNTSSEWLKIRLMSFQIAQICSDCKGQRLNPYALAVTLEGVNFAEFLGFSVAQAHKFAEGLLSSPHLDAKLRDAAVGLERRLFFLNEVGLGYLTLGREYVSLSGGEAQRVRLASQLGMGLVGVTYVLDEPSIGLHPHDNGRLISVMKTLRDRGNTVVVVEHDASTMKAADHLIELGPGAGVQGGRIVFEGTPAEATRSGASISGPFISGEEKLVKAVPTLAPGDGWITVKGATHNNLKNIDAKFPRGLLTVVTGVSGSGKSSLVNDILTNAAAIKLNGAKTLPGAHKGIVGLEDFNTVVRVDQEPIGRSPRSNPATYTKLFDQLRGLFAQTPLARVRGYGPGRFSFNIRGGRCEKCGGDGAIKLDMQFLSDVYIPCPSCGGARYNRETLECRFKGMNIAEVLAMSVDEAADFFSAQVPILNKLQTLQKVGLGYLKLGQAANTLSGGEAQRIKLSLELSRRTDGDALYILDEPTTGLHWLDVQKLMDLLFQLREAGNTVIVIEHDLDVVRLADWVIDLGPQGGDAGGEIVYAGNLAGLEKCLQSLTGEELRKAAQ
jgi:excinuclease ABC subunit A